jgi:hypothetical protein
MIAEYMRNDQITRILMGVPMRHKHIRTVIELEDKSFILSEAVVSGIVRAYITLKTHPRLFGVELVQTICEDGKKGYAKCQLLESDTTSEDVISELSQIIEDSE